MYVIIPHSMFSFFIVEETDAPWRDMGSANDIQDRAREAGQSKGKTSKKGKHRSKSASMPKSVSSQGVSTSNSTEGEGTSGKESSKSKERKQRSSSRTQETDPWVLRADELAWEDELAIMDEIFGPMKDDKMNRLLLERKQALGRIRRK